MYRKTLTWRFISPPIYSTPYYCPAIVELIEGDLMLQWMEESFQFQKLDMCCLFLPLSREKIYPFHLCKKHVLGGVMSAFR